MKRYFILILVLILVLTSGLTISCRQSKDKPSWTEKQTIDYLYGYLVNKAGQLQDADTRAKKIIIGWGFRNAVFEANREALGEDDKLGELVYMQFGELPLEIPTWVSALKRLAKYNGDGLWSVCIGNWKWQVNERTGEVAAQNEEAVKLLEDITHRTYRNSIYNYHIDYPVGWTVTQIGDEGKILIICPEPQIDILIDKPRKLQPGQSLGECASGFASFLSTVDQDFELISLVKLENGDYRMDFEWIVGGTKIHSRTYFVLHNAWVYMISGSAPRSVYESYLVEFDYAYDSFGFY
ncbi:MAG: hypothetical protein IBX36_03075 [Dehalococcoidia bacterium]|nr:hypothetical protein [Dehalococcoidia bacterium]